MAQTTTKTIKYGIPQDRLRYQIQTRSGAVWDVFSYATLTADAKRIAASCRRTGYTTRLVDTRTDAIVKVGR